MRHLSDVKSGGPFPVTAGGRPSDHRQARGACFNGAMNVRFSPATPFPCGTGASPFDGIPAGFRALRRQGVAHGGDVVDMVAHQQDQRTGSQGKQRGFRQCLENPPLDPLLKKSP